MIHITRRERFCAAHMLRNENWDDQKNLEVFGKCSNPNWHGHNFELFVTVKGEVNPLTGFVINLKELSRLIEKKVIQKLDHKNINLDVDFMAGKMASTEVLAIAIWKQLEAGIQEMGGILHCVKLQETENNFVEYYG
ncbi:MAG: 6-pyruvoyl tetrahydrobiopterin synthase [Flavobacteriales bacterium]|nr:6-pyruvoyl tetrahydrobiopterin synthase [Flavobacteriales bacterium]|tara:strand:- start:2617 stop:3027 length:411 start_codon:yes stop_codon:yes gene_type:complete